MLMGFGKHRDKTVEQVMLTQADYVYWLLDQPDLTGAAGRAVEHIRNELVPRFDNKPLTARCARCRRPATYVTVYVGNDELLYTWCDDCDPYSSGAMPGKLRNVRGYEDALNHVEWTCGGLKTSYRDIVRNFAEVKGAPSRITRAAADKFFE